jgi:hypothetical protein
MNDDQCHHLQWSDRDNELARERVPVEEHTEQFHLRIAQRDRCNDLAIGHLNRQTDSVIGSDHSMMETLEDGKVIREQTKVVDIRCVHDTEHERRHPIKDVVVRRKDSSDVIEHMRMHTVRDVHRMRPTHWKGGAHRIHETAWSEAWRRIETEFARQNWRQSEPRSESDGHLETMVKVLQVVLGHKAIRLR